MLGLHDLRSPKVGSEMHKLNDWPVGVVFNLTLTLCSSQQSCDRDVAEYDTGNRGERFPGW